MKSTISSVLAFVLICLILKTPTMKIAKMWCLHFIVGIDFLLSFMKKKIHTHLNHNQTTNSHYMLHITVLLYNALQIFTV